MKLFIKYMLSFRCKMVVKSELDKLGLHYTRLDLGEVVIRENLDSTQRMQLKDALQKAGLELMDDRKAILIEKVKNIIFDMVDHAEEQPKINFSVFISEKLGYDYTYLANLFSEVTGITIEHFIIFQKIERVKELLLYEEFSLTEISYMLNYSSVSHLSSQFKKVTGLTPTSYRKFRRKKLGIPEDV